MCLALLYRLDRVRGEREILAGSWGRFEVMVRALDITYNVYISSL